MQAGQPLFWRMQNHQNHLLFESYCLICYKFIGAGKSEFHLGLVELAHRAVCKLIDEGGEGKDAGENKAGTDS